jgi:FdhE protein
MGMPPIEDQMRAIDELIKERQDLRNPLELHKMILQAQRRVKESSRKGTSLDLNDKSIIEGLQQDAFRSSRPIASFFDPSVFDSDDLIHTCKEVVKVLVNRGIGEGWLERFLDELIGGKVNILEPIGAALKGDADYFEKYGEKLGASPALILFIISALIQPCLEEIANKVDPSFLEKWWQAQCPICGRRPIVAKMKARKRYLVCTLCGSEYLADQFLCVSCDNTDPASLKFLAPEGHPEFRVDFCVKCKHYLKVIDQDKLKKAIPKSLEDIMTIDLDFMAKNFGLIRV